MLWRCDRLGRFGSEGLGQPHFESTCTMKGPRNSSELGLVSQPISPSRLMLGLGQWGMDFFCVCSCAVTGVALQTVHKITGEDKTMHPSIQQHKGAHIKKTTIYSPEQTYQLPINLVRAAGCLTKLLTNRQTAQFVSQH